MDGIKNSAVDEELEKEEIVPSREEWENPPSLEDLKENFTDSKGAHDVQMSIRQTHLDFLNVEGVARKKPRRGFSSVHPKTIRKHAEWRYAALSEAFLAVEDMFTLKPRTASDKLAAEQNAIILNYQWANELNRTALVDEMVRTAVDEGTVFLRVGWESQEVEYEETIPIFDYVPATSQQEIVDLRSAANLQQRDKYAFEAVVPYEMKEALRLTEEHGKPIVAVSRGTKEVTQTEFLVNRPTLDVCNSANFYPDPLCEGDLDKAEFAVYSFESSKSALRKSGADYFNLDKINTRTGSIIDSPDHEVMGDESFNFKDDPRAKFVVYEYWGYWDVDGSGITTPIVAAWVDDTLIRLEESPMPDGKLPFVGVQYLPERKSNYGNPDGFLLRENQSIIGASVRGAIDLMARSANAQEGMRMDALDATNQHKYERGENYMYNPNVDPRNAIIQHTYPEIPNSVGMMLTMMETDANNMTGVRPFGATDSSAGTATADRGVLDAATKRETGVLRRFANAMTQIAKKMIALNGEFLSDEEVFRISDDDFVVINRDNLAGSYDIKVSISTAEEDNAKAQELAFMIQTMGNTIPFEISQIILSDIAKLRKMPQLAERLLAYVPQPDPVEAAKKQLEVEMLQYQIAEVRAKTLKLQTAAQLDMAKTSETSAKAGNIQSDTDQKDLEFLEQQTGVKHARELEQDQSQARGNMALEILKADLQPQQVSK